MGEDSSVPVGNVDPESGELSEADVADVRAALTADEPIDRQHGARTCNLIVRENVDAVRQFVDDLAPLLEDESAAVAQQAGTVLLGVAQEYPEDLTDAVPAMVSLSRHDANALRLLGAQLLAAVVVERPEAGSSDVHRLVPALREHPGSFDASGVVDMVDDSDTRLSIVEHEQEEHRMKLQAQGTLANVLVAVAEAEPSTFFDHVDDLIDLFDHGDPTIAGTAIDAVIEVAQADPDVATPAFDHLVDALDHDDQRVYVRAIRALGVLGNDRAVGPLRDLAESADDDEVSELASDTAEFLERQ